MTTRVYLKDNNTETGCDAASTDADLSTTQGTATTLSDTTASDPAYEELFGFRRNIAEASSGTCDVSVSVTAATDVEYYPELEAVQSSGCSVSDSDNNSGSTWTGTGVQTWTSNSITWGASDNQIALTIHARRSASHGNKTLTLDVNHTDSWVDAPWGGAAAVELASDIEANATVEGDGIGIKSTESDVEGNAAVEGAPIGIKSLDSGVEGNATLEAPLVKVKEYTSDIEGNATIEADAIGVKALAATPEGNANVTGDALGIKSAASDAEGNATAEVDPIGIKSLASDVEANATVSADLTIAAGAEPVELASDIEANATVTGDMAVNRAVTSEVSGSATVSGAAIIIKQIFPFGQSPVLDENGEVVLDENGDVVYAEVQWIEANAFTDTTLSLGSDNQVELTSDVEGNATVEGDAIGIKALAAGVEANATTEGQVIGLKSLESSVEGNATVSGDVEIPVASQELDSSIEANATVSADLYVIHRISSDIEANATVEADLTVPEADADVEVTRGAWLPKKELDKLARIRKRLVKDARERLESKDREARLLEAEIAALFDGEDPYAEPELALAVEPFTRPETPETKGKRAPRSVLPQVNYQALVDNQAALERVRRILKKIEAEREDDEEAAVALLLG